MVIARTHHGAVSALAARASNATSLEYFIFGGSYGATGHLVGPATATIYGWLARWNTTTVPNGSYTLESEAFGPGGNAFSPGIDVTVAN